MSSKHKNQTKQKSMDVSRSESYVAGMDVNNVEQIAAVVGGGALLLYYLRKVSLADALLVGAAGTLIYRGVTNRPFNIKTGIGTERFTEGIQSLTERAKGWAQGWADEFKGKMERFRGYSGPIQMEKSIVIAKSPQELYSFWRNFENLPNIMSYLDSVTARGKRSHWVAKGPAGVPIEWDAEITEDKKNEMISWRALEDADVPNQGTVYFEKAGDGQTELRVSMEYTLPGGEIGSALAEFFGQDPSQKIEEDLNNFKEAVEGGAIMLKGENAYNARAAEE